MFAKLAALSFALTLLLIMATLASFRWSLVYKWGALDQPTASHGYAGIESATAVWWEVDPTATRDQTPRMEELVDFHQLGIGVLVEERGPHETWRDRDHIVQWPATVMTVVYVPMGWIVLLFVLYPIAFVSARGVRYLRRRKAGLCVRCGYDLRGSPSSACPECGHESRKTTGPGGIENSTP